MNFFLSLRMMRYNLVFAFPLCIWILTQSVQMTNPDDLLKEINGCKKMCKSLGKSTRR